MGKRWGEKLGYGEKGRGTSPRFSFDIKSWTRRVSSKKEKENSREETDRDEESGGGTSFIHGLHSIVLRYRELRRRRGGLGQCSQR